MHIALAFFLLFICLNVIPTSLLQLLFLRTKGASQKDCDALCAHQLDCCNTRLMGACWKGQLQKGGRCSLAKFWGYVIAICIAVPVALLLLVVIMTPAPPSGLSGLLRAPPLR